ncbi:vacuolar protein sorting 55-domain-containing protein [Pavlovales sp. CCMP2436]|nr:vacuolar protein sorting 55-domain-containing protein [Pavlovales sp. CCMP2436]|mmetsp:Transcript_12353/g.31215  ORF Transcript_12353/g.31215 Transcript_12353/m.31215 type:complete len:130 (-) Transcript_12353:558-947(-)
MQLGQLIGLSFLAVCSIFFHIFACAIYENWWPALVLLAYMCVPVPMLMFAIVNGGSTDRSGLRWTEFSTSFFFTNVVGIPVLLHHVEMIEMGSLVLSLLGTFFAVACAGLQVYISGSAIDIYNMVMGEQ